MSPYDIVALVHVQLSRLASIAREQDMRLSHVKPHGALYNLAARDRAVAEAIATAVAGFDTSLVLFGLSGSALPAAGEAAGLRVAHEVFAERGYTDDGRLVPRGESGAVIESIDAAIAQARALAIAGSVTSVGGRALDLRADTLCLHGDRADAAAFAKSLRHALEADAVRILSVGAPE